MKRMSFLPSLALVAIIVGSSGFMLQTSKNESATMDELAHIPAGYGYVRYLDYRLNPEHPPLAKVLAGIPLLFLDASFPTEDKSWTEDVNGQWDAGTRFLYHSGNDADEIIFWARTGPILLTIISIVVVFFLAKALVGAWWALVPAIFFAFSPTVLAHGHYVTTDIGAALGAVAAIFSFSSFLMFPTRKKFFGAGILFGIAQLLKFSNALLVPLFIFVAAASFLAEWYRNRKTGNGSYAAGKRLWFYAKSTCGIFLIGGIVVYAVYFLFTVNYPVERQVSDTAEILGGFLAEPVKNFVLYISGNSLLRPIGEYLLGVLMVLQRSAGGNTGYFLGEITNTGWWYYFPVVFLAKETIPALFLLLAGILSAIRNVWPSVREKRIIQRILEYPGTHLHEFSAISFMALYWLWSIQSTLNIGIRHLLPIIPFMYVLSVNSIKTATLSGSGSEEGKKKVAFYKKVFVAGIACAAIVQSAIAYPYFLSFFNAFGGGTHGGYNIVTDSNYDWGQDLKRLKTWKDSLEQNGVAIGKIAIDYFGAGNPEFYIGEENIERWWGSRGDPKESGIEWLAVSVNTLSQAFARETEGFTRSERNNYGWLREIKKETEPGRAKIPSPDARIGTSIFVYHL